MTYIFIKTSIRPSANDNVRVVKSPKKGKFFVLVNGKQIGDILYFESSVTSYADLESILYKMLPQEVEAKIVTDDKYYRHEKSLMLSIEVDEKKLLGLIDEVEMIGCPPEFIQDLKELHDAGVLDELGGNYTFLEDNITYRDFDVESGAEWGFKITTDNICCVMTPDRSRTKMDFKIGIGLVVCYTLDMKEDTKGLLLGFWSKWKKFREENPNLYTYSLRKQRQISKEDVESLIERMSGNELV